MSNKYIIRGLDRFNYREWGWFNEEELSGYTEVYKVLIKEWEIRGAEIL